MPRVSIPDRVVAQMVTPKQAQFLNDIQRTKGKGTYRRRKYKINGFCAGRGSGKTVAGAKGVIQNARDGQPWMAMGPTSPMISQSCYPAFVEECRTLGILKKAVEGANRRVHFRTLDGGSATLSFKSAHNPESIRGGSYAGLWVDEASFCNEVAFNNAVLSLRYKRKQGPVFLTFTPRGRQHWSFKLLFKEIDYEQVQTYGDLVRYFVETPYVKTKGTNLIQCSSEESIFLPDDFVRLARQTMSSAMIRQEIGANFEDVDGLMFSRHRFIGVSELELPDASDMELVRYFDKADTEGGGSYSASVLMGLHRPTGRLYILDVWFEQLSADKRNKKMMELMNRDRVRYPQTVVTNYIEQEGGSAGKEINRVLINQFSGHVVYSDVVSGTQWRQVLGEKIPGAAKINRALLFAGQVEQENVYYVKTIPRMAKALDMITSFPETNSTDVVDCCSGCVNKLLIRGNGQHDGPSHLSEYYGANTELLQAIKYHRLNKGL